MLVEKSVAPVPVLAADASLEEVREHFSHDRFVSGALGAQILEAAAGHAVCAFDLEERHLNEKGGVMGGAIFSLGDFAIVVAATVGAPDTVSVAFNVNFMSAPKGGRLIATADEDKRGRTLESVVDQYLTTVKPMHEAFVEPSKKNAHIIIPEGGRNQVALDMLMERIKAQLSAE